MTTIQKVQQNPEVMQLLNDRETLMGIWQKSHDKIHEYLTLWKHSSVKLSRDARIELNRHCAVCNEIQKIVVEDNDQINAELLLASVLTDIHTRKVGINNDC